MSSLNSLEQIESSSTRDDFYYIEMIIPGIPESYNKNLRKHFQQRRKANQYWYDLVKTIAGKNLPKSPLKKASIKIIRRHYRFLDWDGAVGSIKPIVDGLIHARIIKDDSYKITGPWDVTQEFRPKKEGGHIYVMVSGTQNKV